jgi:hypothetical protein
MKRFRKLLQAAKAHELEIPQLGPFTAALEEAIEDLTLLKVRQMKLQGESRQTTEAVKAALSWGSELEMKLKSFVRAVFGRRDDRLAEFGVKALGRPRGSRKEKKGGSPGYTH